MEQHNSKNVDDNKNTKILMIKSRKVATITVITKLTVGKLLTTSIKIALIKERRDVSMRKI